MTQFEKDMKKAGCQVLTVCSKCGTILDILARTRVLTIKDSLSVAQTPPGTPPCDSRHVLYCIDCVKEYCEKEMIKATENMITTEARED